MKLSKVQRDALDSISMGKCYLKSPWRPDGKWRVLDRQGDQICRPATLKALRERKLVVTEPAGFGEHNMPIKITDAGRQYLKESSNA